MYEKLKCSFVLEMKRANINDELQHTILNCLDVAAHDYSIGTKETALIPYQDINAQFVTYYIASKSVEGLSKLTLRNKQYVINNFFKAIKKPCSEIMPIDVRGYLYNYQMEKKVSNRTMEFIRTTLRTFFHWCFTEKFIQIDPTENIPAIKYEKKERKFLSQLEMEYLRKACRNNMERVLIEVMYSTACRISEIRNMKITDVDWDNKCIDVLGKGNKHRKCYLNARAFVGLKNYLKRRKDKCEYIFVFVPKHHPEEPPKPFSDRYAESIIPKIASRDKRLGRVTAHQIRHSTATHALRNGMPIEEVSRLLGHVELNTTMVYAKVADEAVQRDHQRCII